MPFVCSPKHVRELRATALLSESSQASLYLVRSSSFLAHSFQIVSISQFDSMMSSVLKWIGVNTSGGTYSWGVRKKWGVTSRGVSSLLFNVICSHTKLFPGIPKSCVSRSLHLKSVSLQENRITSLTYSWFTSFDQMEQPHLDSEYNQS